MQGGLTVQGQIGSARQMKEFSMKDHISENVQRMRQIQKNRQQKEAEAAQPVKSLWKSERYSDTPSRIKQDLENPSSSRPGSATFLRAHSRSGPPVKVESRPCTPDLSNRVPLALSGNDVKMEHRDTDFIKVNGRNAKHPRTQRPSSVIAMDAQKKSESVMADYNRGEVPGYLKHRQKQWKKEEEERQANIPDPAMPPGHRSLPEPEQLETLSLLQDKQKEMAKELAALPIATDTLRVHNKRREMESKLVEVEEAIRIFSRPKVFVKIDS